MAVSISFGSLKCASMSGVSSATKVSIFETRDHPLDRRRGEHLVHHGDHVIGAFDGPPRGVDRRAERHVAMACRAGGPESSPRCTVRRRNGRASASRSGRWECSRHGRPASPCGHSLAQEGVGWKTPSRFRIGIGCGTLRVRVVDMHVFSSPASPPGAHGVDEALRCGATELK